MADADADDASAHYVMARPETQLVEEQGSDIRQQLEGLKAKGWILVREAADGMMVVDLTGPAWKAVRSRRDVGR
ncbi:hypothetical protein ABZ468_46760 [Streptomyces sp. NPDC005708]|uniref:hypothetical protein n=1 Tax=unclassified Streptomyces TaxID=2593676 RepID=UPI0033F1EB27